MVMMRLVMVMVMMRLVMVIGSYRVTQKRKYMLIIIWG